MYIDLKLKKIEVHDQSRESCNSNKQTRFETSSSRSDICDYSDAYISIKETITAERDIDRGKRNRGLF